LDIFKENLKLRNIMGKNGLMYVRENYSWSRIIKKYTRLFDYLLKKKV